MVEQRVAGLPIEHIVGYAEFCGLRISVDPGVFVPRRRTEHLVEEALRLTTPGSVVVDLCCGSGALGVALHAGQPDIELYAADLDPAAVACARRNVEPLGGQVFQGNLYAALPPSLRGRIDVLLSNVPYVPTDEIPFLPAEARLHEPHTTLDGGADGLSILRQVAAEAADWLAPGGTLLVETTEAQAPTAAKILTTHGLTPKTTTSTPHHATAVTATNPPHPHPLTPPNSTQTPAPPPSPP
jgi:release factor glutamine methyltransferase